MLAAFLTTLFFALSMLCASRATALVGSNHAHFLRLIVAVCCLLLYAHSVGQGWQGQGLILFLIGGAVGIGLGDLGTFHALRSIPARLVSLLVQSLCAPFAALVEWLWLGTTLSVLQSVGLAVTLFGTGLSLLPGLKITQQRRLLVVGTCLAAFAAFAQAVGAVLTRKAIDVNVAAGVHVDGFTAAYQRVCGGFFIILLLYLAAQSPALAGMRRRSALPAPRPWKRAAPWIIMNGLLGLVLGVASFQWALMLMPAAIVLSVVALTPLLVMAINWLLEGERPPPLSIGGGVIAVIGVVLMRWV